MKLYEIDQRIAEILDNAQVDEETGEAVLDFEALAELQMARVDKLEGAALYVKDLEAMAKAIREEEKNQAARRQAMENKAERIKAWLAESLQGERLETPKVKVSVSKPRKVTVIDDVYGVLEWFVKEFPKKPSEMDEEERREYERVDGLLNFRYPAPVVDKAGVKRLLDEGNEIPGAHVEDGKASLRIQ